MKNLITVVVPIYNVEEYLSECINSIINQTYENIEILLIDDGSTDKSGIIADDYSKRDDRIRVYHKNNGGLSDARNYGIDRAKGKYITFIDSDDFVSDNFLEVLYNNLNNYNADISGCVYKRTNKREIPLINEKENIMVWDSKEALRKMLRQEDEFTTSACALLYKIECFRDVRYPYNAYYEDLGTTYRILHNINRIVRTSNCLYHYFVREGSISNKKFNVRYMDQYKFAKDIQQFVYNNYENLKQDADMRLVGVCFNILMTFDKETKERFNDERKILLNEIYSQRRKMIIYDKCVKKVRVACIMTYFGISLCELVYKCLDLKGR